MEQWPIPRCEWCNALATSERGYECGSSWCFTDFPIPDYSNVTWSHSLQCENRRLRAELELLRHPPQKDPVAEKSRHGSCCALDREIEEYYRDEPTTLELLEQADGYLNQGESGDALSLVIKILGEAAKAGKI